MSFQKLPGASSNHSLVNSTLGTSIHRENLNEFFQIYETFKARDQSLDTAEKVGEKERMKRVRSQKLLKLKGQSGCQ